MKHNEILDLKIIDKIRKTDKGYVIYSEKGKRLSKPYKTRGEAEERLKEIEKFKHMKKDALERPELYGKHIKITVNNALSNTVDKLFGQTIISKEVKNKNEIEYILSYNGTVEYFIKRFHKPYKIVDSLKKDSYMYKGYGIEETPKGFKIYKYDASGKDIQIGNDFSTEEDAKIFIDNLVAEKTNSDLKSQNKKPLQQNNNINKDAKYYIVTYIDNDTDRTSKIIVFAKSEQDAKRRAKKELGRNCYRYPLEAKLVDNKTGGLHMKKDSKIKDSLEEIDIELDGELDKFVEEGYYEFCKCLEQSKEGQFKYSEKLTNLLNKISNFTNTTETEVMNMYREMAEKEEIESKKVSDSKLKDEDPHLLSKLRKVLEKYLLSQGYDKQEINNYLNLRIKYLEDGSEVEIANDLVGYYDLPDSVVDELDAIVDPGYFEPYSSTIWIAFIPNKNFKDSITPAEGLIRVLKTVNVPHDTTFQYGNDNGLYLQIQNVGLGEHEDIIKYKHVSPKLSSFAWGRIWNNNKLIFNEEEKINILKQDMIDFLQNISNKIKNNEDSTQLMDLLTICKDIIKRTLVSNKLDSEKIEMDIKHQKEGDVDTILFECDPKLKETKLEEDVVNNLNDEIKKSYPNAKHTWSDIGCSWVLEV